MRAIFSFFLAIIVGGIPAFSKATPKPIAVSQSQTDSLVYFERLGQGLYRFYYDDNYYLADKSCQFVAIVREAGFDPSSQTFDGSFVDYNLSGRKILSGSYHQGLKSGVFQAYHNNGQLKWEVNFIENQPLGQWKYYYPDGKPMLVVNHSDEDVEIWDYWDTSARQRVTAGNGRYRMHVEIKGYNEYGATFLLLSGRLKNGKPERLWSIDFVYPDNTRELIGQLRYQNGRFHEQVRFEQLLQDYINSGESIQLIPQAWFIQAENFVIKKCNIDEYSGFTDYLIRKLEEELYSVASPDSSGMMAVFTIRVSNEGIASSIIAKEDQLDKKLERRIKQQLESIGFWFPSWKDGEYIDDELTLSFKIMSDPATGLLYVEELDIQRNQEF